MTDQERLGKLRRLAEGGRAAAARHDNKIQEAWWDGYLQAIFDVGDKESGKGK
jgi:hypothetical protein